MLSNIISPRTSKSFSIPELTHTSAVSPQPRERGMKSFYQHCQKNSKQHKYKKSPIKVSELAAAP